MTSNSDARPQARFAWARIGAAGIVLGLLAACGGGGGSADDSTAFGPAVAIQFGTSPTLRMGVGTSQSTTILAVDARGHTQDVTAQASASSDKPSGLTAQVQGGALVLSSAFHDQTSLGLATVHVAALGKTLDQPVWVTGSPTLPITRISLQIGAGYSVLTHNADGSYSMLPSRALLIAATAYYDGGFVDITPEISLASSDANVVSAERTLESDGNIPWWTGHTLAPGSATLTATWAGFTVSQAFDIHTGLIVRDGIAQQMGITENAAGRTTVWLQLGASLGSTQFAYTESGGGNQWHEPVQLAMPPSSTGIFGGIATAEAPNGHRAVLARDSTGATWAWLIGPDGTAQGPMAVYGPTGSASVIGFAVSADGNAHVWSTDAGALTRRTVRWADAGVVVASSIPMDAQATWKHRVVASTDGTVALAWLDRSCGVHYGFDRLATPSPTGPTDIGVLAISECAPTWFTSIDTAFDFGAGADDLGLVIHYGTAFDADTTEVITAHRGGAATLATLDHDRSDTVPMPRLGMAPSGEFVAIWATETRGIRGVHRAAGAVPDAPIQIQEPFFSLATPGVDSVHARGDGRFVMAWIGSLTGLHTPLDLREYASATGVGPLMIFPYQDSEATNTTSFVATPNGISAVWSFPCGLGSDELDAMQDFLP